MTSKSKTTNEPELDEGTKAARAANAGFGQANPADPSLNNYDIYNQGAPARGDDNTSQKRGEPAFPDGPPTSEDLPVPEYGGGGSGIVEPTQVPETPEAPVATPTKAATEPKK